MKNKNKDNRSWRRALTLLAALIVIGAIVAAIVLACGKLRSLWLEQCVITDVVAQIEIQTGNTIKADAIREIFGLHEGANLALIDFAAKRKEALRQFPRIKTVEISRRLPDGVSIRLTERDPFAKINLVKAKRDSGLVCDNEGVVFTCRRGAEMLPTIRYTEAAAPEPGKSLESRARAALAVLKVAHEAEFANLNILEIDVSRPDFLTLVLANYTLVKFCWEGMDDPAPSSDAALRNQLAKVSQVIATNLQPETRVWNATQPGLITADLNGRN